MISIFQKFIAKGIVNDEKRGLKGIQTQWRVGEGKGIFERHGHHAAAP